MTSSVCSTSVSRRARRARAAGGLVVPAPTMAHGWYGRSDRSSRQPPLRAWRPPARAVRPASLLCRPLKRRSHVVVGVALGQAVFAGRRRAPCPLREPSARRTLTVGRSGKRPRRSVPPALSESRPLLATNESSEIANFPSMVRRELGGLPKEQRDEFFEEYRRKRKLMWLAYLLWIPGLPTPISAGGAC